jgi:NAD(P)-dependent dehydrogenase (short-subunit alcohol dehydrogenase family)
LLNIIVGANQGIGYYIAQALSQSKKPYQIIVGARNPERGNQAVTKLQATKSNENSTITTIPIDVSSHDSIVAAADTVSKTIGHLDILVNNAGIWGDNNSTREDWARVFDTNVFGTVDTFHIFLPLLLKSSDPKHIIVSSSMGSITMAEQAPRHPLATTASAYRASKAAVNMVLAEITKNVDGLRSWGVDPGLCATEFGGDYTRNKGRDPREAGDIARQCIEGERDDCVGKVVWEENGTGVRPW